MDALKGIITTNITSLFIAILFAYLFRIPIPFAGYLGPFGEINSYNAGVIDVITSVVVAWVFYGVFGGFIIFALLGAMTGILLGRKYSQESNKNRLIILWSAVVSIIPVFLLSILDYIIGPW